MPLQDLLLFFFFLSNCAVSIYEVFFNNLFPILPAEDVVDVLTDLISPGDDEFAEEMDTSPAEKKPGKH